MSNTKRCRGTNFTTEEEIMLLEEIAKQKQTIECKTTNKCSNEEKEEAWRRVLKAYNAKSVRVRTMDQIKSKFDNLKSKTRKVVAAEKSYYKGTGGGKCMEINGDPVIEAVLQIINFKTVVGLQSAFDSDAVVYDVIPIKHVSTENENQNSDEYGRVLGEVELQPAPISSCDEPVSSPSNTIDEISAGNGNVLREIQTQPASFSSCEEPVPPTPSNSSVDKDNWSSYVPRKLKMKTNSKLRPTVANPIVVAKELYYRRKLELLEAAEAREACEHAKKAKREEEHAKKMILMEIEIQLKRKQLNN